jgi:SagB-type dehydrogenase family enzyme
MGGKMANTIGLEFMENTKYLHLDATVESQGGTQPPLELPYAPDAPLIKLPDAASLMIPAMDLRTAIEQRTSLRRYTQKPLTLDELAYLLWATQGVKKVTKRPVTLRTVPSAGARHAFETYLLVNWVEGLTPGLYRYIGLQHALIDLGAAADINEQVTQACLDQNQVRTSAVTFIWVAVTERMTFRYTQRGYRYLHLDAGHVCQNLYLLAEQTGCGVCAIAAFDDDLLNAALKLDGVELFAIYLASLGKRGGIA